MREAETQSKVGIAVRWGLGLVGFDGDGGVEIGGQGDHLPTTRLRINLRDGGRIALRSRSSFSPADLALHLAHVRSIGEEKARLLPRVSLWAMDRALVRPERIHPECWRLQDTSENHISSIEREWRNLHDLNRIEEPVPRVQQIIALIRYER